ncbi:hypothetical protein RclHR1_04990011 [Rhizophagus clarus]|uniref:TLDc domain-containing protein n=1 Tax=Rhizophagus clarus TaxID=94130 RepID=A0A2Z6RJQ2_9GLOM|nr:hypothetical protein RclHR1_04990011 [Rhizophagus clarus]
MNIDLTQGLLRDLGNFLRIVKIVMLFLELNLNYLKRRKGGITLFWTYLKFLFDAFKIILRYIYTGYFSFNDNGINQEFLFDLIFAADELRLCDLVEFLQIHIVETNSNWIRNNLTKVYQLSLERNFVIIQDYFLIKILKRDDLDLQEIDIWRYILKWGLEQDPPLILSDIKRWTNEEFYILEKRLHNLIPFIRFFSIPATQYYKEVRPFKNILPEKLREDIEAFYILSNNAPPPDALPPRKLYRRETIHRRQQMRDEINYNINYPTTNPRYSIIHLENPFQIDRNNITPTPAPPETPPYTLGNHKNISDSDIKTKNKLPIERENSPILNISDFKSSLINKHQAKRIIRWINDNKNFLVCGERVNNNSHVLELLSRGSRDGMFIGTFHSLCDNKGPTVIVAKVKESKNIIGGYNPNPWTSSNKWVKSAESFIFSFKSDGNREGIDDIILSRIKNPCAAIFDGDANYDVGFGLDLQLFLGTYERNYYEKKIMEEKRFTMEDYEVFLVKRVINE